MTTDLIDLASHRPVPFLCDERRSHVLRELLHLAFVLVLWAVLWAWGAATLAGPWGPDPETRAAMAEAAQQQASR